MTQHESARAFFYREAGYSWNPAKQTREQGRRECAARLALVEALARDAGYSFSWELDQETTSADFSDADPPWRLWVCIMYGPDGKFEQCLGAVDFGRDGEPWGKPYRRVVEAEMASEAFPRKAAA